MRNNKPLNTKLIASALTLLLTFSLFVPSLAIADEKDELQSKVEQTAGDYNEALANYKELEDKINSNKEEIKKLQKDLPEKRQSAASAIRSMYKFQKGSPTLISLILSTDNFKQCLAMVNYLDAIQHKNFVEVGELAQMQDELKNRTKDLEDQEAKAKEQLNNSKELMDQAIRAREEAQRKALEEARKKEAEAKAAAKAAAEAARKAEEEAKKAEFETESGNKAEVEVPPENIGSVDWSEGKTNFVNKWTPRIDSYMAGSPMAGHGKTFAEAAWDYGVDPRWSPAISCIESTKGAYCFKSHNAWGWGGASWSNWDDAIRSHVKGLSAPMYKGVHSVQAAQTYCPPNWQFWYSSVKAQMAKI